MKQSKFNKIGVFTSGGDSPGMNACLRAVVRTAVFHEVKVAGIIKGFQGMIDGDFIELGPRDVSNIIQRGGTIIKAGRCKEFEEPAGRSRAYKNLEKAEIDGLIAIGGDGTFRGALEMIKESGMPIVGIPGTIDNDLFGTDFTLGFDTAVNNALDAVDKIRDTAASHDRLFFIEVMGRDAGYIALWSGIAGGAEAILLPEEKTDLDKLINVLRDGGRNHKSSSIIIVCEGDDRGGAADIAKLVEQKAPEFHAKVTVLGHVQRGGSPTATDRMLGSRFGVKAVEAMLGGESGKMIGILNNQLSFTSFEKATKKHAPMDLELLRYAGILST